MVKREVIWYAGGTKVHLVLKVAIIAQSVERIHGKDKVNSSILFDGSNINKNPRKGFLYAMKYIFSNESMFYIVLEEKEFFIMDINHENLHVVVGSRAYEVPDLVSQYEMLMRILHGEDFSCSDEAFDELLKSQSEVLVFVIYEGAVLATAQVSYIHTLPRRQALVNNVVVETKYQGHRLGKLLMDRVRQEAEARWRDEAGLRIWLTNNPNKGNAGFYEKLGFSPRTVESGDLTVVWELES